MRAACLKRIHDLARRDDRVVYIGSDPGPGTMDAMKAEFPDRCLIEGISEANVIGMAAGLAMDGYIPFVNTIATFLTRRCYDQIAVDLCLHNLPVRLVANGGGVVYAPLGPTHQATEDIAIMRALPNMAVVAVADAEEMDRFMSHSLDWPGPIYIRLAKGRDPVVTRPEDDFVLGQAIVRRRPGRVLLVTTGITLGRALEAADALEADGIATGVLHAPTVKPFDAKTLVATAGGVDLVATVEEHSRTGGLGGAVLEALSDHGGMPPPVLRLGLPDRFAEKYGSQNDLLHHYGLDAPAIAAAVRTRLAA